MSLELEPPYAPMEALLVERLPAGQAWQYEPKWDGFRCIAFRDGDRVELQSKAGQLLTRYFPEVVDHLLALKSERFILDGELVVPVEGQLSFDMLLQRIHPADSRVLELSRRVPALYIVFDLLADERGHSLAKRPLADRRPALERWARKNLEGAAKGVRLSPATLDVEQARRWLAGAGGALDGVVAKRRDLPYRSGERTGMQKIKRLRSADCVVGGFRYASHGGEVGTLLLGLYDDAGKLDYVGHCSGFTAYQREKLTPQLEKLIAPPGFDGERVPGAKPRWGRGERSTAWQPLEPRLVAEVRFDHFTGGRFRHGTSFLRWRPDKAPRQCTLQQLEAGEALSPLAVLH